ncbi:MAG: hypothetical protein O3C21_20765 [Verrucomicrobia bacterium]|nr:hypothetical protein [Verrucomicrobiota bacterium]
MVALLGSGELSRRRRIQGIRLEPEDRNRERGAESAGRRVAESIVALTKVLVLVPLFLKLAGTRWKAGVTLKTANLQFRQYFSR